MDFAPVLIFVLVAFCCCCDGLPADGEDTVNLTEISRIPLRPKGVVEVLLFIDKEHADMFGQDEKKIKDQYTILFRDVNYRYQSLIDYDLSFRVTGMKIFKTFEEQPFVEEARDPNNNNRTTNGELLSRVREWAFKNRAQFPKFDLLILATGSTSYSGGGMSYMNEICNVGSKRGDSYVMATGVYQALVYNSPSHYDAVALSHEMGHILGADHDWDVGCDKYDGYLMGSGTGDTERFFFSPCANRDITKNIRKNGQCLFRLDEPGPPVLDFSEPLAPTFDSMCNSLQTGWKYDPKPKYPECQKLSCTGWTYNDPYDNGLCGKKGSGSRCFRGRCLSANYLLSNVGTGKCVKDYHIFSNKTYPQMAECIRSAQGTPLDRYMVKDNSWGKSLAQPYDSTDMLEHDNKCLWAGAAGGNYLQTRKCDGKDTAQGWDFVYPNGNDKEFMLKHRVTQRCVQGGTSGPIATTEKCDLDNANMRWRLI